MENKKSNEPLDERAIQEIVKKLLTFDQDACFESVKKQMVKEIKSNISSKKVISLEENILHAEFLTCLYFTFHHIPRAFYSFDFVERKYPELVQRIRKMVEDLVRDTSQQ